jgi:Zn-dependent protease
VNTANLPENEPLSPRVPEPPQPRKKGGAGAAAAGVGFLLLKLKSVLALLKFATIGKLLLSGSSMFLYIGVMALRSGPAFGVGFVVLLLLHELGHATTIRRHGLKAGWPIFIPFFGAMIALKERPPTREIDAEISFGGPLWGTIASFGVASVYFLTRSPFWLSLGYTGLFLNMFNLTPVRPLDGGAIVEMFSRRAWILGGIVIVGLFLMNPMSPALLMMLFALPRMLKRSAQQLEPISDAARRRWAIRYFGLLGFAAGGMYFTRTLLTSAGP